MTAVRRMPAWINRLKLDAAGIGSELLVKAEDMSAKASSKLELLTAGCDQKVNREGVILVTHPDLCPCCSCRREPDQVTSQTHQYAGQCNANDLRRATSGSRSRTRTRQNSESLTRISMP